MQAVRDLRFSSVDREDIRTYFSSVIHRSNHFQTNHLCRTFKKMHESQLPLQCSFGKKLWFRWLSNMIWEETIWIVSWTINLKSHYLKHQSKSHRNRQSTFMYILKWFDLMYNWIKIVSMSPLSINENRRSLADRVFELFEKQLRTLYFETANW